MSLLPPLVVFLASLPFLYAVPLLALVANALYAAYYLLFPFEPAPIIQSLPVGSFDDSKEGQPRRNPQATGELLTRISVELNSVADMLTVSANKYADKPCLGSRKMVRSEQRDVTLKGSDGKPVTKKFTFPYLTNYEWKTYAQVVDEVKKFAAGLLTLSSSSSSSSSSSPSSSSLGFGSRIAMFASTRSEWLISFHGCMSIGLTVCTVYPSLGADALVYSLEQTEVSYIITDAKLIDLLLKTVDRLPNLHTIIYFDELKNRKELTDKYPRLSLISYEEILTHGTNNLPALQNARRPGMDDLSIIMYTSGSTGNPKGVMITHGNIVAMTSGVLAHIPNGPNSTDTYIAFLPLAHVLELCAESALLCVGGNIGYASSQTLKDDQAFDAETGHPAGDIKTLKPTLMAAVPLILDKLQTGIKEVIWKKGANAVKLFEFCFWLKRRAQQFGHTSYLADFLIFNKVRANFGGRLRFILSGGAPLSPQTQLFINVVLGCPVLQGYGLTETAAGGTVCHPDDHVYGKVGGPLPSTELKLIDVPEMGYTHRDTDETGRPTPRGEIAIRGPAVSRGYFKMEDKTKSEFVSSPYNDSPYKWFMTGDIGQLLDDGSFKIIDRKKDLVKLMHGEYVALGNLESVYSHASIVDNICVYGDADHMAPVALVVLNHKAATALSDELGIGSHDVDELVNRPQMQQSVLTKLNETANHYKLEKWERVIAVHLIANPWTPESGLVTEAFKLKRHELVKHYRKELDQLYARAGQ